MSTHILSSCWSLTGMSPTQKLVLISLADQANDDGVCWPSIRRMSERTCLSDRAIRDAVAWLSASGILSVTHRYNSSNVYTITASNFSPVSAYCSPPAPSSPPAPIAGTPCAKRRTPLRQVPPNHQGTVREPSVGDSRPATADGQAYLERVTSHENANQPITMTTDWQPGDQFPALMMRAGMRMDRLTDEILAKFVIHHNGTSKPQNKWESALVTWCKRETNAPKNVLHGGQNDTSKPHPLAFSEENRPERGPYALFKPGPKKTPMTDESRARVEQLRRQAFGDTA